MMHKLRYMALGGLLMFIGMLTASVLMPNLVAQRDIIDEFTCSKLTVLGGDIVVLDGKIQIRDATLKGAVEMGISDKGNGYIATRNKQGATVQMTSSDYGGAVLIDDNDGNVKVKLTTTKYGGGIVAIGNDGHSSAILMNDEYGGIVQVHGHHSMAVMNIDSHGNGAVSTRDKNGYVQ